MKHILFIVSILFLFSCNTLHKAQTRLLKVEARHPELLTKYCADKYPNVENTTTKVEYVTSIDTFYTEPILVDCDSIVRDTVVKSKLVLIKCPPSYFKHDTIRKEVVVTKWNTALVKVLGDSLSKEKERTVSILQTLNKTQNSLQKYKIGAMLLVFLVLLFFILKTVLKWKNPLK
jgi:hypothetical protein